MIIVTLIINPFGNTRYKLGRPACFQTLIRSHPAITKKEEIMSTELTQNRDELARRVRSSLNKADEIISGRKKVNTGLLITGMTSSAAATLIAGITAAQGPVIGTGTEGWRLACIVAAIFGFASTVSSGLSQQLKVTDHLSEGKQCANKLKLLDVGITTGNKSWEEITQEFEEIARTYPEYIN